MYVPLLIFVAIVTMTVGNLAAISQNNLKRLLAYSSIAHVGYMLLGLVASDGVNNSTGIMAIMIYLLVYTFMNLGAFAVITSLRRRNIIGDEIDDIAGLYFKAPVETMLMLVFLLSLAGIPPLAGFWGKYFIFLSLIQTGHYTLASFAVLYAVIGLYYYMRIASAMIIKPATDTEPVSIGPAMGLALLVTAAGTIGIGIFPNFFINAVNWSLGLVQGSHVAMLLRLTVRTPMPLRNHDESATVKVAARPRRLNVSQRNWLDINMQLTVGSEIHELLVTPADKTLERRHCAGTYNGYRCAAQSCCRKRNDRSSTVANLNQTSARSRRRKSLASQSCEQYFGRDDPRESRARCRTQPSRTSRANASATFVVSCVQTDGGVGTQFGSLLRICLISSRSDHSSGAEVFRDLNCELAGDSRGAQDQNTLARARAAQW